MHVSAKIDRHAAIERLAVGAAAAGGDRQGTESRLAEHPRDAAQILGIPRRDDDIRGDLIDAVVQSMRRGGTPGRHRCRRESLFWLGVA